MGYERMTGMGISIADIVQGSEEPSFWNPNWGPFDGSGGPGPEAYTPRKLPRLVTGVLAQQQEAQRIRLERFDRCVAAGYPAVWEPDLPLTRAKAHFEHFEGPNCHPSGRTRPGAIPLIAKLDKEVCCHPRDVVLPELPPEIPPVVTNGQALSPVTNGQEQLAMDRPIPWGWIAVGALGAGALVWFTKR